VAYPIDAVADTYSDTYTHANADAHAHADAHADTHPNATPVDASPHIAAAKILDACGETEVSMPRRNQYDTGQSGCISFVDPMALTARQLEVLGIDS